ncbi:type IX secretion system protein PorD [Carboxylicivirga linearis]|uniref:DUF4835 family protein n=1 Tax=Carboxylicivirga linearis TaxID=1628157 RepID=A0ABS5JW09_9BACT|nr:DUF4835 family protein [Carboxylicivirga linearis]MBS2098975.1 DUF4835 family protein [Carboxylicivirga linearis]
MLRVIVVLFLLITGFQIKAQEFQCAVQVVSPSIQGSNKKVFETLQTAIREFMNNQNWTNDVFKPEERIDCNIMINVAEMISVDEFRASIQIQARRPVYNSSYYTVIFNHQDQDLHFKYVEFEPLVFNPNSFDSNLVGVLAYYAYIILGMDYDSFSSNGGTDYFRQAEQIVNQAQGSSFAGWKSFDSQRNRYWLTENILNEYHRPLRKTMYTYHRKGLDIMNEKPEEGRAEILKSLEDLRKVYRQRPGSFFMQVFFTAKSDELVKIFEESFSMEKNNAIQVLQEVDPANSKKYDKLSSN